MPEYFFGGPEIDRNLLLYIQKRRRLSLIGGGSIFAVFFTLVLLIAFFPHVLLIPIGAAPGFNLGMLFAFLVLISIVILTGLYVRQTNRIVAAETMRLGEDK